MAGSPAVMTRRRPLLVLVALMAGAVALKAGLDTNVASRSPDPTSTVTSLETPAATPPGPDSRLGGRSGPGPGTPDLKLVPIARLSQPIAMAMRPGDPRLYFAEKGGRVRAVSLGPDGVALEPPPVILDLSDEVSGGSEQGLLGLAFSPDGASLYLNFTDRQGTTQVVEYPFDAASGRPAPERRTLLSVDQPFVNHNGGNLVFGPDNMLWIGLGDGGSANDPGNRAQTPTTLLGKLLRIDPRPSGDAPYSIPPDNPNADRSGPDASLRPSEPGTIRAEIWASGLRNPWRYSFDRQTGDLWIADVGQNAIEEINFEVAGTPGGRNYGWSRFEGSRQVTDREAPNAITPVFEFSHRGGNCSVTGGYVYRGEALPELSGTYLYSDFCGGGIRGLRRDAGGTVRDLGFLGPNVSTVVSFGQDAAGELYVLTLQGTVHRIA